MLARHPLGAVCALLTLALMTLVLAGPTATAQEPTPPAPPAAAPVAAPVAGVGLAEQFPPGTMMLMRTRDIERQMKWMAEGPLGRLVRDPEVKPLWDQLVGMATGMNKAMMEQVGVDFLQMLGSVKGEFAMGVTRFQIGPAGPSVGVMLALDCGAGADRFKQDMTSLLKMVPPEAFKKTDREVKGLAVTTYTPTQKSTGGSDPMSYVGSIHTGWVGSVLLISNDKSAFDRSVLVRSGDQQTQTLGQTDNWRDTMDKLGGAGDSTFYLNVQSITELLEALAGTGMIPEEAAPIINALGLDQFPAIGSATFMKDEEVTVRSILRYTGDGKSGIGSLLALRKTELAVPAWVPEDAMQVMVVNYDFPRAFDGVISLVQEVGEEPYEEFQQGLEEFQQEFGISLQDDLLAAFAGPIVLVSYAMPPITSDPDDAMANPLMGGTTNPTLIGLKIRNRKAIEQFLSFFEQMGAEVSEYMGATIFAAPDMSGDGPMAEAAITDDYLLLGIGPTALIRPTLQRMGGREPGFGGVEGVRDAVQPLPKEGVGLVISNQGKAIANSLNMMKALSALAGKDLPMLASFPVPSSAVLEKHLGWSAGVILFEPGVGLIADSNWRFKKQ